jgi:hypothetical protein
MDSDVWMDAPNARCIDGPNPALAQLENHTLFPPAFAAIH